MRRDLDREGLLELMKELARTSPKTGNFNVYIVGGASALLCGWRASTIDADLYSDQDEVFRDIQGIKARLQLNIEFARPEQFVPPLNGTEARHVFIQRIGNVDFYHYDPYAQLLSKIVRGFDRDLADAHSFVTSGMVDPEEFRALVDAIPASAYQKYPNLTRSAVVQAVDDFLASKA